MICQRCQQPLDQWGEHFTSRKARRRRPVRDTQGQTNKATPQRITPPARPRRVEPILAKQPRTPGVSRHARMLALVSADERYPTSAADVATALQFDARLAGICLCMAAKQGQLRRVARGRYVRA